MKFDYRIKFRNFRDYLELKSIIFSKRRLLKNKNSKLFNIFSVLYITLLALAFTLFLGLLNISNNYNLFINILLTLFIFINVYIFIVLLIFYIQFYKNKKNRYGKLIVDEDGLIDVVDKGYIFGFTWDKIDLIVKGKYSTVIFSKLWYCLYISNDVSEDLLKEIKKHNKNIKIVDKTTVK